MQEAEEEEVQPAWVSAHDWLAVAAPLAAMGPAADHLAVRGLAAGPLAARGLAAGRLAAQRSTLEASSGEN